MLALPMLALPTENAEAAPAPKLSKTSLTITVGASKTLKVKSARGKVKWSTSNAKVAKVTSKGVVKGIKAGTARIRAKVSKKTLTCTVKVKNANATAESVKFANATGGDFVKGVSNATVSFVLTNTSTDVKVRILNTLGNTVYTRTYAKCKANKVNSFAWNGKNSKGKYVGEGMYRACITAGSKKTYSNNLRFCPKEFAAGDGSKSNPYQVKTLAHLRNVNKHNGRHFRQVANIDGDDANFTPMFTTDNPFTGTYDGRNYTICKLYFRKTGTVGLFTTIGVGGIVQNVKVRNFTIKNESEGCYGLIAGENYGKILNCVVSNSNIMSGYSTVGGITGANRSGGIIQTCTAQSITLTGGNIGGIVGSTWDSYGECDGRIVNCKSISVTIKAMHAAGGITGDLGPSAVVSMSSTTGNCLITGDNIGAIVGNRGQVFYGKIEECWTDTDYPLAG